MATFKRPVVPRERIPDAAIAKWGLAVLSEGFVPFPKKLLRCLPSILGENGIEKLQVIMSIVDYLRDDLKNPPSKDYLAFIAGLPKERFKAVLTELHANDLVDVSGTDEFFMANLKGLKDAILNESAKADKARDTPF